MCFVMTGSEDRAFISCNVSNDRLVASVIGGCNDFWEADHVHISGYFSCKGLHTAEFLELVRAAKERRPRMTFSLDTQFDESKKWTGDPPHYLFAEVTCSTAASFGVRGHCE